MTPPKSSKTKRPVKKSPTFDQSQPGRGGPPIWTSPLIEVRDSGVHGRGVFAVAHIPKRTRILEYLGDRVSHDAADARYEDHDENDNHTFLFIVDKNTVIDASVGGNDARFINHQCAGNCESVIAHRRVFIDATRDIAPGEELGYDYEIGRDKDDPPNVDEIYACRCGSPKCRGTMLWPPKRAKKKSKAKAKAKAKAKTKPKPKPKAKRTNRRSKTTASASTRRTSASPSARGKAKRRRR